ncbi:MAG: hypothetical protein RLZZ628_456 [Bacteroidota bacterium]|jgi:uncharacterized RDD family membrane protein YckC
MDTIEIMTAQNVRIEYTLATLRERIFASIIDMIVIICLLLGLSLLFSSLNLFQLQTTWVLVSVLAWGGLYILYQVACDAFLHGRTLGKLSQKLQTARLDGKQMSLSNSVLRAVLSLVDTYYCGGVIAMMLVASTDKRQRLGDMAAGTTVINLHSSKKYRLYDVLNTDTQENYTPVYPQVRRLSEEDMLTIQQVLRRVALYRNAAQDAVLSETTEHICKILEIPAVNYRQRAEFLRGLIKDYIVLTR